MGGISGSSSKSKSSSSSSGFDESQNTTQQAIFAPQQGGLESLFSAAGDLFQNQQAAQTASGFQQAGQLSAAGQNFLGGTQALADPRSQIAAQEASLASGLGNLFQNQLNPAISSNAINAGGFGGSRQGVAQGQAIGQLGQAYTEGLGDITARANQQALGAQGQGIASLGSLFDMGMAGYNNAWNPLQQYQSLLGAPTVLTQAQGTSYGSQESASKSKSSSFSAGASIG